MFIRKCEMCGSEFETSSNRAKYCVLCRDKAQVMRNRSYARKKKSLLNNPNHLILEAPHPSPLSAYRGFFGCKHFSQANEFLKAHGQTPIDWQIENLN